MNCFLNSKLQQFFTLIRAVSRVQDNILQPFSLTMVNPPCMNNFVRWETNGGKSELNSKIKREIRFFDSFHDEESDSYSPFLFFNVSVEFAMFHYGTWLISQWPWGPSLSSSQFNWLVVQWGGPSDESGKPRPRVAAGLVR